MPSSFSHSHLVLSTSDHFSQALETRGCTEMAEKIIFQSLPVPILLCVFDLLPIPTLISLTQTCQNFRNVYHAYSDSLTNSSFALTLDDQNLPKYFPLYHNGSLARFPGLNWYQEKACSGELDESDRVSIKLLYAGGIVDLEKKITWLAKIFTTPHRRLERERMEKAVAWQILLAQAYLYSMPPQRIREMLLWDLSRPPIVHDPYVGMVHTRHEWHYDVIWKWQKSNFKQPTRMWVSEACWHSHREWFRVSAQALLDHEEMYELYLSSPEYGTPRLVQKKFAHPRYHASSVTFLKDFAESVGPWILHDCVVAVHLSMFQRKHGFPQGLAECFEIKEEDMETTILNAKTRFRKALSNQADPILEKIWIMKKKGLVLNSMSEFEPQIEGSGNVDFIHHEN